jgi:hypothetical protein
MTKLSDVKYISGVLVAIGANGEWVKFVISPSEWVMDRTHMMSILACRIDQEIQRKREEFKASVAMKVAQLKSGPKEDLP